jgi:hypothetical protein
VRCCPHGHLDDPELAATLNATEQLAAARDVQRRLDAYTELAHQWHSAARTVEITCRRTRNNVPTGGRAQENAAIR